MRDSTCIVDLIDLSDLGDQILLDALLAEGLSAATLAVDQIDSCANSSKHPAIVLLRLGRDSSGGLAMCRRLRAAFPRCAMCLIHDGLGEWEESIALELGADAVISQPTEARRVVAQVRALQRLKGRNPSLPVPRLTLLAGSRTMRVDGVSVYLTDAEFVLLSVLAEQAGQAVSRDAICRQMRGLAHEEHDRAIDLRIARIRQKLGDNPHKPLYIRTVRGEGYMLMVGEG
ncbi:MAG: response regulator transcription factor [Candidatus Krumholzibacteria bacterium]|nr:response regulator transcription factor [Candidatus Krumholzibacteria bacterium]